MPIMYRCPGELRHNTRGFLYDERDMPDADKARADGWAETLEEAAGLVPMPSPAPATEAATSTRAELEAKAKALGVSFNARTSDETLIERIAAKG